MKKKDDYYTHLLLCLNDLINNVDLSFNKFIKYCSSIKSSFDTFDSHQKKALNQLVSSNIPHQFLKYKSKFSDTLYNESYAKEINNFLDKRFVFEQNAEIQRKLLLPVLSELNTGIQSMIKVALESSKNDYSFDFHKCLFEFIKMFRERSGEARDILENIIKKAEVTLSDITTSCDLIMNVLVDKIPTEKNFQNVENPSIQKLLDAMSDVLSLDYVLKKIIMPFATPLGNNELVNYFHLESDLSRVQPARIKENCIAIDEENNEIELEAKLPVEIIRAGYSHYWEIRVDNIKYFVPSVCISI